MVKVKEIMTSNIRPVNPTDSIAEVARQMTDQKLPLLPVCEKGKLKGIITDTDIIASLAQNSNDLKNVYADSLMIKDNLKVPEGVDVVDAAKIMASHGVRHLPVIHNGGRFAGLLTMEDLVKESLALASMVLSKHNN